MEAFGSLTYHSGTHGFMMRYMVLKMDTGIVPPAHVMLFCSEFSREHDDCINSTHTQTHTNTHMYH